MQLAHTRRGGGPLLVVLRQLERESWNPVLERLSREREVVAVDLPGFGDSPALAENTTPTIQALAAAVAAWLSDAGLDRPPVAGNSLGGAVALELARTGAVGGAVAVSPIGLWTSPEAAYALGSLRVARRLARALGDRTGLVSGNPLGRTLAFWQLVARPWRMPPSIADAALRTLAYARTFDAVQRAVRAYRLRPFEPAMPVTIAWGTRDMLTPPHQARRAARLLPKARHVALPGCGHSPMAEAPDQVARLIGDATAP